VKNTVYISWNNILYRVAAVYIAYRVLNTHTKYTILFEYVYRVYCVFFVLIPHCQI
jgi:hypothetical protein